MTSLRRPNYQRAPRSPPRSLAIAWSTRRTNPWSRTAIRVGGSSSWSAPPGQPGTGADDLALLGPAAGAARLAELGPSEDDRMSERTGTPPASHYVRVAAAPAAPAHGGQDVSAVGARAQLLADREGPRAVVQVERGDNTHAAGRDTPSGRSWPWPDEARARDRGGELRARRDDKRATTSGTSCRLSTCGLTSTPPAARRSSSASAAEHRPGDQLQHAASMRDMTPGLHVGASGRTRPRCIRGREAADFLGHYASPRRSATMSPTAMRSIAREPG